MSKLRRLRQFKHDRAFAGLDHAGDQRLVAIGERRFSADPARRDRFLRPQHDNRFGGAQGRLRHLIVGLARAQAHIPPDLEALRLEGFGKQLCARLILAVIGEEDVSHVRPSGNPVQTLTHSVCAVDAFRDCRQAPTANTGDARTGAGLLRHYRPALAACG
jgi:hypothetical protein